MATTFTVNPANELLPFYTDAHEPVRYAMYTFVPTCAEENWSLKGLTEGDTKRFYARLAHVLMSLNLRTVFAPSSMDMSGLFVDRKGYTIEHKISPSVTVWRPNTPADIAEIFRGEAGAGSYGGCGGIVLTFRDKSSDPHCLYAHAGLGSLVDMNVVHLRPGPRTEFSVVDALVTRAIELGGVPERMHLRVFGVVPWQAFRYSFDDPKWGEDNFTLVSFLESEYGKDSGVIKRDDRFHECICLETIIRIQAERRGVKHIHAHGHGLRLDGKVPFVTHPNKELGGSLRYLQVLVHQ